MSPESRDEILAGVLAVLGGLLTLGAFIEWLGFLFLLAAAYRKAPSYGLTPAEVPAALGWFDWWAWRMDGQPAALMTVGALACFLLSVLISRKAIQ